MRVFNSYASYNEAELTTLECALTSNYLQQVHGAKFKKNCETKNEFVEYITHSLRIVQMFSRAANLFKSLVIEGSKLYKTHLPNINQVIP